MICLRLLCRICLKELTVYHTEVLSGCHWTAWRKWCWVVLSGVKVYCAFGGKGKSHTRTGHEGPKGEKRYSCTLSLISALDGVGGQHHAPTALLPGKRLGTHCIGGCVGPRAGMDGCGKSRPKGFDPRTDKSVASRCTDWVIPVRIYTGRNENTILFALGNMCK
jgi:hypothetical protein